MATPALSTTGYVLHNLGLATGFGGTLFGRVALDPSTQVLSRPEERGKIANQAWKTFNILNSVGLGLTAATWLVGRAGISGRGIDTQLRGAVLAKDLFLGGAILSGLASMVTGRILAQQAPEGAVPIQSGVVPSLETPETAARAQRALNVLGFVHLACTAAVIGLNTFLDIRASRNLRWKALSRFLP